VFRVLMLIAVTETCLGLCGCGSHRDDLIVQLNKECRELRMGERDWSTYSTDELEKNLEDLKSLRRSANLPAVWDDNEAAKADPGGILLAKTMPVKCSRCGSSNIKPYAFGRIAYEKAVRGDDSFIYGGGSIRGNYPAWKCMDCGTRFYRSWKVENKRQVILF